MINATKYKVWKSCWARLRNKPWRKRRLLIKKEWDKEILGMAGTVEELRTLLHEWQCRACLNCFISLAALLHCVDCTVKVILAKKVLITMDHASFLQKALLVFIVYSASRWLVDNLQRWTRRWIEMCVPKSWVVLTLKKEESQAADEAR